MPQNTDFKQIAVERFTRTRGLLFRVSRKYGVSKENTPFCPALLGTRGPIPHLRCLHLTALSSAPVPSSWLCYSSLWCSDKELLSHSFNSRAQCLMMPPWSLCCILYNKIN